MSKFFLSGPASFVRIAGKTVKPDIPGMVAPEPANMTGYIDSLAVLKDHGSACGGLNTSLTIQAIW
jgi:hypothetical protein